MSAQTPVVFLKAKSHPSDPYDVCFRDSSFAPLFVPVLEHRHINLDALERLIVSGNLSGAINPAEKQPAEEHYGGLIITSQRAVEALGAVITGLKSENTTTLTLTTFLTQTKVYVVGPATSSAIIALGFTPLNVLGQASGNGKALAEFILKDYNHNPPNPFPEIDNKKLPLLFLTGETHRDIIPQTLSSAPPPSTIQVTTLKIYATTVASSFREDFEAVVSDSSTKSGGVRWIVVFSPAGADVAVDVLDKHNSGGGDAGDAGDAGGVVNFVAAIGPTTEGQLKELGRMPEVVAGKPSPEGVLRGILEFMEGREKGKE